MHVRTVLSRAVWPLAALSASPVLAADATFLDEAAFLAVAPGALMESFEALAASPRALAPIGTPLMTLLPGAAGIGVQTGPATPLDGFGAFASDGSQYVSVYAANAAPGTLTFTLATPSTVFGLSITDAGEAPGSIILRTDTGAYVNGVTLLSFSSGQGNGQLNFIGLTQDLAFSQVFLTLNAVDEAFGVDEVYVNAVPEPAAAWSLAAGLLGLGALLRRRRSPRG